MSNLVRTRIESQPQVFVTEAELAERWRHSLRSLQRWRADGKGPPFTRLGRRIVYRLPDIENFEAVHMCAGGRK